MAPLLKVLVALLLVLLCVPPASLRALKQIEEDALEEEQEQVEEEPEADEEPEPAPRRVRSSRRRKLPSPPPVIYQLEGDEEDHEIADDAEAEGMTLATHAASEEQFGEDVPHNLAGGKLQHVKGQEEEEEEEEERLERQVQAKKAIVSTAKPWEHLKANAHKYLSALDRPVKFKELLHEYKHSAGHANSEEAAGGKFITRVGDIHTSHAVLHELAPASRQGFFKHVDQLARVGVPKHQLHSRKGEVVAPELSPEQHAALRASTRAYMEHQWKAQNNPDKVARWEALNQKAIATNWLNKNEKARQRGFRVDDRVTRRMITPRHHSHHVEEEEEEEEKVTPQFAAQHEDAEKEGDDEVDAEPAAQEAEEAHAAPRHRHEADEEEQAAVEAEEQAAMEAEDVEPEPAKELNDQGEEVDRR